MKKKDILNSVCGTGNITKVAEKLLYTRRSLTMSELAKSVGIKKNCARDCVKALQDQGFIFDKEKLPTNEVKYKFKMYSPQREKGGPCGLWAIALGVA